jgi:hypothetical protein
LALLTQAVQDLQVELVEHAGVAPFDQAATNRRL